MLSQSPYLQNSQLVQRPANNVVPTIPPSSASYYSASAGKVNLFIHGLHTSLQGYYLSVLPTPTTLPIVIYVYLLHTQVMNIIIVFLYLIQCPYFTHIIKR